MKKCKECNTHYQESKEGRIVSIQGQKVGCNHCDKPNEQKILNL